MVYADESFYTSSYLLGKKPAINAGFLFYAQQASQLIDCHTFGRLKGIKEVPEEVRMCCCELAEAFFDIEKQEKASGGKISEKIGTYSVSFGSAQENVRAAEMRYRSIILKWLGSTGLCYQGV